MNWMVGQQASQSAPDATRETTAPHATHGGDSSAVTRPSHAALPAVTRGRSACAFPTAPSG